MDVLQGVVDGPEELTAEWCTWALRAAGFDVDVERVEVEAVGTGQTGASYRVRIGYPAGATPAGAPATLVAKLGAGSPEARARVAAGYRNEVDFYRLVAPTVDVSTPRCHHAALSEDGLSFTLLLDEVVDASAGVQVAGCSIERARSVVDNAAALHAPRWNDRSLRELRFLGGMTDAAADFVAGLQRQATDRFVERFGSRLSDLEREVLLRAADVARDWQLARPEPFAVVHGDYRLDNFMFDDDGDGVTVLDWQTVTVGPPLRDVAYFCSTSLPVDVRRAEERDLVARYHSRLVERGVAGYDADACWDDYRLGLFQAPFITMIGAVYATAVPTAESDAMFLAMATRSAAAIADLDAFDVLARTA